MNTFKNTPIVLDVERVDGGFICKVIDDTDAFELFRTDVFESADGAVYEARGLLYASEVVIDVLDPVEAA